MKNLMPILMLSPGGPYQQILEQLVSQLEPQDADGALTPGDRAILARAKLQLRALKDIGDTRPDRYQRIVYVIEQYHEGLPQAQTPSLDDEQKRTLN